MNMMQVHNFISNITEIAWISTTNFESSSETFRKMVYVDILYEIPFANFFKISCN